MFPIEFTSRIYSRLTPCSFHFICLLSLRVDLMEREHDRRYQSIFVDWKVGASQFHEFSKRKTLLVHRVIPFIICSVQMWLIYAYVFFFNFIVFLNFRNFTIKIFILFLISFISFAIEMYLKYNSIDTCIQLYKEQSFIIRVKSNWLKT